MTSHRNLPTTYDEAADRLGGRASISAGNNTKLVAYLAGNEAEPRIGVVYHQTEIATFYPNGNVSLNSGGWRTSTTKDRLHIVLGARGSVYQKAHVWYVHSNETGHDETFFDGITFSSGPRRRADLEGTHCECGAPYGYLPSRSGWGYTCAR